MTENSELRPNLVEITRIGVGTGVSSQGLNPVPSPLSEMGLMRAGARYLVRWRGGWRIGQNV